MTANDASIQKTILITAKPDREEDLRHALIDLQNATRPEPGCVFFSFYGALDDAGSFVLIEKFTDAAAFDAHMQMPYTKAFFAAGLVEKSAAFG
jgi:quinol monooxygenase YgiN